MQSKHASTADNRTPTAETSALRSPGTSSEAVRNHAVDVLSVYFPKVDHVIIEAIVHQTYQHLSALAIQPAAAA